MKAFGVFVAGLVATFVWHGEASASDYYHECGLPGGEYRMHDETLYSGTGDDEKELRYKSISKVVVSETEGYCVGRTGNKYGFKSQRYLQRVEVRRDGERVKLDFYCELASDGLPAGDECKKQVMTLVKRLVPAYTTKITKDPEAPNQN